MTDDELISAMMVQIDELIKEERSELARLVSLAGMGNMVPDQTRLMDIIGRIKEREHMLKMVLDATGREGEYDG